MSLNSSQDHVITSYTQIHVLLYYLFVLLLFLFLFFYLTFLLKMLSLFTVYIFGFFLKAEVFLFFVTHQIQLVLPISTWAWGSPLQHGPTASGHKEHILRGNLSQFIPRRILALVPLAYHLI